MALRHIAAIAALMTAAAAPAPEPPGYWLGARSGAVPGSIAGGTVITTPALAAWLRTGPAVLIDVSPAPRRPPGQNPAAPWLPLPHRDIPGSLWIPDAGLGQPPEAVRLFYQHRLEAAARHNLATPVILYCHAQCWLSWNAAKRAISFGYRRVIWYPNGVEGWSEAGYRLAPVAPEGPGAF